MSEPDLTFISQQIERVLVGQRDIRNEMQIIRGEIQNMRSALYRIDDAISNDILTRLRALEQAK